MIMQSTESFTEKEKYTPWGCEVTESVKAEKDTLCRKFLLLLPTHKSLSRGRSAGWRLRGEGPRSLGKTCWRPLLPDMLDLTCPSGSWSKRFNRVTDTSPRLLPRGGSESPRTRNGGAPPLGIRQLPFPDPARTPGPPRPPGRAGLPSRGPPAPKPRGPQARGPRTTPPSDPAAGPPPHLSAGQTQSPDLLSGSRLRKPPPGHPPRAGGGYGGGGCDPNGPLHAPSRAAGGRGASHARAGTQGRAGGLARGPCSPRTEPREPGTRDSGEGSWGGRSHRGAPPRPRSSPPRRAGASPAGAGPARSTRGAGGGNRTAEAAAPRRPAPRRWVRAQPARSAAGGWAVPICGGGGGRSVQELLPVPFLLALRESHPRKVEYGLCFGLGKCG